MVHFFQNKGLFYATMGFVIFIVSFFISLVSIFFIKKYAVKLKLVDAPGERKIHTRTMPLGGGIGIVLATITSLFLVYFLAAFFKKMIPGEVNALKNIMSPQMLCILGGGIFIFIVGLVDDYINLSPKTKLCAQILVAIVLFCFDVRLTIFINNIFLSFCVTVFWIVLISNSFNLLDNMDGLSAGVGFIVGLILIWVMVALDQWLIAFVLTSLLGALLGFLRYNFSPASIFMGDSGSLFLGYLLASLTIYANFYQASFPYFPIVLPLLAFAVPIFDTTTVTFYRWKSRRPIFKGDTNHFSHRLTKLGLHPKKAVLVIYLVTFATGINATLLYQVDDWIGALVIIVQLVAILSVINILEHSAIHRNEEKNG